MGHFAAGDLDTGGGASVVSQGRCEREAPIDPALLDRRITHLPGIDEARLPIRAMSIAGLEGKLAARVLSKDMSGPTTRIVRFERDWGSGAAGAFTADVSLLVISGRVRIGDQALGRYDFAHIPRRCLIPSIRAETGTLGLLLTAAPVAYDTTSGGVAGAVKTVLFNDIAWKPQPRQPGRFLKPLVSTGHGDSWLSASVEWSGDDGPWHRHSVDEEVFILDGAIAISELGTHGAKTYTYQPGGYLWRPAGILHAGPGSSATDTAITFHHTSGDLATEWVDRHSVLVPSGDEPRSRPESFPEG